MEHTFSRKSLDTIETKDFVCVHCKQVAMVKETTRALEQVRVIDGPIITYSRFHEIIRGSWIKSIVIRDGNQFDLINAYCPCLPHEIYAKTTVSEDGLVESVVFGKDFLFEEGGKTVFCQSELFLKTEEVEEHFGELRTDTNPKVIKAGKGVVLVLKEEDDKPII